MSEATKTLISTTVAITKMDRDTLQGVLLDILASNPRIVFNALNITPAGTFNNGMTLEGATKLANDINNSHNNSNPYNRFNIKVMMMNPIAGPKVSASLPIYANGAPGTGI